MLARFVFVRTLLAGLLLGLGPVGSAQEPVDPFEAARVDAQKRQIPLLVDFRAPWCYSCYYMARHVHQGAAWDELRRRAVVVELDADSPEGAARMKEWNLKALPGYVLFDSRGQELGRILGEQPRTAFYTRIEQLLEHGSPLDELAAQAARGGRAGLAAAVEAIAAFHARQDAEAGLKWFYDLPGAVRRSFERDPALQLRLARLRLMQAAQAGRAPSCLVIAPEVLNGDLGCERPYELDRVKACLQDPADGGGLAEVLRQQREPMEHLVEGAVFGNGPACADQRSAVLGLAEIYAATGDEVARERLLRRAVADLSARMGDSVGRDRNLADNLRLYLEILRDWPAYDALMPRLIAAWPDDYVYAFRFGRSLLERDRSSEALPYLERAATKAYGVNRLKVAEQRVRALKRLGQETEARRVAADALKANGPWFQEDAERLRLAL